MSRSPWKVIYFPLLIDGVMFAMICLSVLENGHSIKDPLLALWPAFVFFPVLVLIQGAVAPFIIYPELNDSRLRLIAFGIAFRSIKLTDIEYVEKSSGLPGLVALQPRLLFTSRWGFSLKDSVVLVKKRGVFWSSVVLSPSDPDSFFDELQAAINNQQSS
jgi:hypothetical protein